VRLAKASVVRLLAWTASVAAVAWASVCAYHRVFSFFSANDDEGYVLQSVRSYVGGDRLFEEVFTQYGPAFYALEYLIHGVLRAPLTHDFERFAIVGVWVATTTVTAEVVRRLTGSWIFALLTFIGVFVHLTPLINEPGHPQAPLVLTIALVCLVAAWRKAGDLTRRQAVLAGVLTAFAVLVKVNVGVYLLLGFAIPVMLATKVHRSCAVNAVQALALLASCALPLLVARTYLDNWAFNYAVIVAISVASTIVVVARSGRRSLSRAVPGAYALAAALTSGLLLLPVLVQGTSISALITGTIIRPAQFASTFALPLLVPSKGLIAAGLGLVMSIALTSQSAKLLRFQPALIALVKALAAGAVLFLSRLGYDSQIGYLTPFLWIVVLLPRDVARDDRLRGRSVLAFVAVFQALQAYPVAGSQLAFATFLMIPIGLVCAHDAFTAFESRLPQSGRLLAPALRLAVLFGGLLLYRPVLGSFVWRAAYDTGYELRLDGARRLRLPRAEVARYQWLAGTVRTNCGALLTIPGLYSVHAWSGLPPLNGMNVTTWMTLLSEREQASLWSALGSSDRPCVVFNPTLARNWLGGRPLESLAAYRELHTRFHLAAELDGYQILVARVDEQSPSLVIRPFAGRQAFGRGRSPLPVASTFVMRQPASTIRTWLRTDRTGVILGCQSQEGPGRPSAWWLPLLYVGKSGTLRGQHWTAGMAAMATEQAVSDGRWHHVALVRDRDEQHLYVDGEKVGSLIARVENIEPVSCQAGTGATNLWPDGLNGWMPLTGEVDGLEIAPRAWSAEEVRRDWLQTRR